MPIITSLSTRFLGHPRLMNPTFGMARSSDNEVKFTIRDRPAPTHSPRGVAHIWLGLISVRLGEGASRCGRAREETILSLAAKLKSEKLRRYARRILPPCKGR